MKGSRRRVAPGRRLGKRLAGSGLIIGLSFVLPASADDTELVTIQATTQAKSRERARVRAEVRTPREASRPQPSERWEHKTGSGATRTSADGTFQLKVGARIQIDSLRFSGAYNADDDGVIDSGSFVRRARVSLAARHGAWGFRVVTDHSNKEPRLVLAHLTYGDTAGGPTVALGLIKEDVSLEAVMSSRHSTAISRPLLSNAFSPYYSYGIRLAQSFPRSGRRYAIGVYKAEGFGSTGRDSRGSLKLAVTGRGSWSRHPREGRILHLGAWASQREFGEHRLSAQVGRGELSRANTRLVNYVTGGDELRARSLAEAGLEAAIVHGRASLQGEYAQRLVQAVLDSNDRRQDGYYLTASYFLTRHSRAYDSSRGVFVTPRSPENAWEVLARVSSLDATHSDQGTAARAYTAGVSYYWRNGFRLMLNYLEATVTGPGAGLLTGEHPRGKALVVRLELAF